MYRSVDPDAPEYANVRPQVVRAARLLRDAGWRITRLTQGGPPSASHLAGRALDAAPVVPSPGLVGPRTAVAVATMLMNNLELTGEGLVTIAEPDHLHIEEAHDGLWRVGTLRESAGRPMEARIMRRLPNHLVMLEAADIFRNPGELGDRAIGDPSLEEGDFLESGDPEVGYVAVEMLDPDLGDAVLEAGDPAKASSSLARVMRKPAAPAYSRPSPARASPAKNKAVFNAVKRAVTAPTSPAQQALGLAAVAQMEARVPGSTDALLKAAASARATPIGFPWIYPDTPGLAYQGGTVSASRVMKPSDANALLTAAYGGPKFQFANFPFTVVGAVLRLDVDAALSAQLALGTVFPWVGTALWCIPTALNAQLDNPVTVTVTRGGNTQTANFNSPEKIKGFSAWISNALIFSDEASPDIMPVTVAAVPSGTARIEIAGLNVAVYTAQARFLLPGDTALDRVRKGLELTARQPV